MRRGWQRKTPSPVWLAVSLNRIPRAGRDPVRTQRVLGYGTSYFATRSFCSVFMQSRKKIAGVT